MNYQFPVIRHIDDVLPHVQGREEFIVAIKDGYTVINYVMMTSDTFRPFTGDDDIGNAIRRECRGIIFDNTTGEIIRRPYHKFFNIGEREETMPDQINLSVPHRVLRKLDGSMIAPFYTSDGRLRIGTKMGETEVAEPAGKFIHDNPRYLKLILACRISGHTPIFEWMSRDNRIVIDYGEPQLVLTAIRNIHSGVYDAYDTIDWIADNFGVPVVENIDAIEYEIAQHLVDVTRHEVGTEGYVVRFDNGHMAKVKSDWYVAIHKAKENLLYERYVLKMVLENTADDVIPHLLDDDRRRLEQYRDTALDEILKRIDWLAEYAWNVLVEGQATRKDFALEMASQFGPFASIVFRHWDWEHSTIDYYREWHVLFKQQALKQIIDNCNTNSKLASFKKAAGFTFDWKETHGD